MFSLIKHPDEMYVTERLTEEGMGIDNLPVPWQDRRCLCSKQVCPFRPAFPVAEHGLRVIMNARLERRLKYCYLAHRGLLFISTFYLSVI